MIKYICNNCGKDEPIKGYEDELGQGDVLCEKCWKEYQKRIKSLKREFKIK